MTFMSLLDDPEANMWRESEVATERHPISLLPSSERPQRNTSSFLSRIPSLPDMQAVWLFLYCTSARANYLLRVVPPDSVAGFAQAHDVPVPHLGGRRGQVR